MPAMAGYRITKMFTVIVILRLKVEGRVARN